MDKIGIPQEVDLAVSIIHTAHEEILALQKTKQQANCTHNIFSYLHSEFNDACKYCQIDACSIRECKKCGKVI